MIHFRRTIRTVAALFVASLVLLAPLLHSRYLWLPESWGIFSEALYRVATFVSLPFRPIAMIFFPPHGHDWPLAHYICAALLTPIGIYAIFRLIRAVNQRVAANRNAIPDMGRRAFLAQATAGAATCAGAGFVGYVSMISPRRIAVREYSLAIRDFPQSLDGMRIVQVSDTHYGPYTSLHFLEDVMERANGLGADLIALTGDYVHHTPESIENGIGVLRHLQAPLGVVAVCGNHDHWEGIDACRSAFARTNIHLIDNDRLFLSSEGLTRRAERGRTLCIGGIGDLWEDAIDFYSAFSGVDPKIPRILLSHNPDAAECIDDPYRVDLMMSGHTHGGQVAVPGVFAVAPSRFGQKYLGGLCAGPRCPVVVSRGIGVTSLPMRFNVPPELVAIELTRA